MVEIQRQVAHSEVNADFKAKYASIITYMQDCSFVHLLGQDGMMHELDKRGMGMFLTCRQCNLYKIPVFEQDIVVRTWVYSLNRFIGYRNTVVYDKASMEVLAASYAGGAFVDLASGLPAHIPDEAINDVLIEKKFDGMEYLPRKVAIPDFDGDGKAPFTIYRSHIDSYGHTNNAQYIRMVTDCLDEEVYPKIMRAEYKIPAKSGDKIYPTVYKKQADKTTVVLRNGKGDVCLSCELTM